MGPVTGQMRPVLAAGDSAAGAGAGSGGGACTGPRAGAFLGRGGGGPAAPAAAQVRVRPQQVLEVDAKAGGDGARGISCSHRVELIGEYGRRGLVRLFG